MNKADTENKIRDFLEAELDKPPFAFIDALYDRFKDIDIYLVGGAVRDILLERAVTDFDFVVRNVEAEELEDFLVGLGKLSYVGKKFGVYKFRPYDTEFEIDIAFPRREVSKGHGYKDFEIIADSLAPIQEDLMRRDFTVNAFGFLLKKNTFIDKHEGLKDLKEKRIRTVGDPRKRFSEDYTRILRAVRQAIQLDFSIDVQTKHAIQAEAESLNGSFDEFVSREMILKEFLKSFSHNPLRCIEMYDVLGLLPHILPDVERCKGVEQNADYHPEGDVFQHIKGILAKIESGDSLRLKLAALFHDIAKPHTHQIREVKGEQRHTFYGHQDRGVEVFRSWAQVLGLSHTLEDDVSFLIKHHLYLWHGNVKDIKVSKIAHVFLKDYDRGKDLIRLHLIDISFTGKRAHESEEYIRDAEKYINSIREKIAIDNSRIQIPVDGNDIKKHFPNIHGREIGQLLEKARDKYLEEVKSEKYLTKSELIDFLKADHNG